MIAAVGVATFCCVVSPTQTSAASASMQQHEPPSKHTMLLRLELCLPQNKFATVFNVKSVSWIGIGTSTWSPWSGRLGFAKTARRTRLHQCRRNLRVSMRNVARRARELSLAAFSSKHSHLMQQEDGTLHEVQAYDVRVHIVIRWSQLGLSCNLVASSYVGCGVRERRCIVDGQVKWQSRCQSMVASDRSRRTSRTNLMRAA